MILAETLPDLLTDRSHMMFEALWTVGDFVVGALVARIWIKIHDRRNHKHEHCEDVHEETSQSKFWTDLQENLNDPEFLKAYIDESIRIAIIDKKMNDNKEVV